MSFLYCAETSEFNYGEYLRAADSNEFYYSNEIHCAESSQFNFLKELTCAQNSEFSYYTSTAYDIINGTTTGFHENIVPDVVVTFRAFGGSAPGDYSAYIKDWTFTKVLGGKTHAEITFVEHGLSGFAQLIKTAQPTATNFIRGGICGSEWKFHRYDPSRYFLLNIAVGYQGQGFQSYQSPCLLSVHATFDGTELKVFFEDFTALLEQKNQTYGIPPNNLAFPLPTTPVYSDLNADHGQIGYAHATILNICKFYGISNVTFDSNFKDYLIRLLRMVRGVPLDWIDQIARVYQAKRSWIGNTLNFKVTIPPNQQTPKWSWKESEILGDSLKVGHDLSNYKNRLIVVRSSPNGGIIGQQECIGYNCPGRTGDITFDTAVTYASAVVEVTQGIITDFVYFDASGTPITDFISAGPNNSYIQSATPVKRVKFTYIAQVGNTALPVGGGGAGAGQTNTITTPYPTPQATYTYTPKYNVTFFGKNSTTGSGIDSEYRFLMQADSDELNCLGIHQENGDIDDPLIPNVGVARQYAANLLSEYTRKVLSIDFSTPYHKPWAEPGECFSIYDYETSQNGLTWLIEEMTISGSGNEATTQIKGSRGRN